MCVCVCVFSGLPKPVIRECLQSLWGGNRHRVAKREREKGERQHPGTEKYKSLVFQAQGSVKVKLVSREGGVCVCVCVCVCV